MTQQWQIRLNHVPYQRVVHVGVAMYQDIAKGDNASIICDARCQLPIKARKLRSRLANDLKLAHYSRSQHSVALVISECLSCQELGQKICCTANVKQVLPGLKPRRSVSWSLQRAAGRRDSGSPTRQQGQHDLQKAFPEPPTARNRRRHTPPRATAGTRPESPGRWRPLCGRRKQPNRTNPAVQHDSGRRASPIRKPAPRPPLPSLSLLQTTLALRKLPPDFAAAYS